MTEERLQKIADNLHLQILGEKGMGYTEHSSLLQEKIDLFNEVVRLKALLQNILDYCRNTEMTIFEYEGLVKLVEGEH